MKTVSRRAFSSMLALGSFLQCIMESAFGAVPSEQARTIAKEAYIYGHPMVDGYRILNAYFVDKNSPKYKGPWNQFVNISRVYKLSTERPKQPLKSSRRCVQKV